ncbi:hypothetical protein BC628DRAFT_805437 [Trametes gibbosa]|nr:hypothetical protein BC628DRAFT_805437 [Trametes gibbosa]
MLCTTTSQSCVSPFHEQWAAQKELENATWVNSAFQLTTRLWIRRASQQISRYSRIATRAIHPYTSGDDARFLHTCMRGATGDGCSLQALATLCSVLCVLVWVTEDIECHRESKNNAFQIIQHTYTRLSIERDPDHEEFVRRRRCCRTTVSAHHPRQTGHSGPWPPIVRSIGIALGWTML